MSIDKSQRKGKAVPIDDNETVSVVPGNDKKWVIDAFVGAASYLDKTVVYLVWDPDGTPDILASTNGDASLRKLDIEIIGDGTKKLDLVLLNDTGVLRILSGSYKAREL